MVFTMDKKEKEKRAREEPREIANRRGKRTGRGRVERGGGRKESVTAVTARHHDAATGADWTVIAFWVRLIDMGTRGGGWDTPPA